MGGYGFGYGSSGGGTGSGGASIKTVTQSLTSGSNTVNHDIGTDFSKTVRSVTVLTSSGVLAPTDWDIIDTDNINVELSGGTIANAVINITYS